MRMLPPPVFSSVPQSLAAAGTMKSAQPSLLFTVLTVVLAHFTYFALVVILIIAGTGMPIPEDVPLILSGWLCSPEHSPILQIPRMVDTDHDGIPDTPIPRRVPNLYFMMLAGMIGVLAGDSVVFTIGRRGIEGNNRVARHLRKVLTPKRRAKIERHFERHGNLTVFGGRFLPIARGPIFAFAGLSKMSYFRFLLLDGFAAAISVPTFIYGGYYFAANIEDLFAGIDRVKHIVGPIVLVLLIGAAVIWYMRRKRARTVIENV